MKIVKEYLDFDTFKSKCDDNLFSIVQNKVNKIYTEEEIKNSKKILTSSVITFALGLILSIAAFFTFFFPAARDYSFEIEKGARNINLIAFLVLALLGVGLICIGIFLFRRYILWKTNMQRKINFELKNVDNVYEIAFKNISPSLDFSNNVKSSTYQKILNLNGTEITKKELYSFLPIFGIQKDAKLIYSTQKATLLIDDLYPLAMHFNTWKQVKRQTKKQTIYEFVHQGVIKIKIEHAKKQIKNNAIWSLQFASFLNRGGLEFENSEFNKTFTIYGDNKLDMFKIFTPFTQELLLKRANDTQNILFPRFKMYVAENDIYFIFPCNPEFMEININYKSNPDEIVKRYYQDILKDVYSFYYFICYIYIPAYL
ncbi:DUF3137 domain-containing protein [Mycoplasmopsis cricetuli]|uniref:DUF3137 domain-containing protein n=1 Tax=Mycoplasmopsis cricetuli TaxID=171283 RepID=UPI0004707A92|nr:DUF3137 domain-containing protein [Mycoplasmopsis cricetuli]